MARRRNPHQPGPGVQDFERTASEWRQLGAPLWAHEITAAAEAYVHWAVRSHGGGHDPTELLITRHFARRWLTYCVHPQLLAHLGALTETEQQLMTLDKWARWGRPGQCRARMLTTTADVPDWLACCRHDAHHDHDPGRSRTSHPRHR